MHIKSRHEIKIQKGSTTRRISGRTTEGSWLKGNPDLPSFPDSKSAAADNADKTLGSKDKAGCILGIVLIPQPAGYSGEPRIVNHVWLKPFYLIRLSAFCFRPSVDYNRQFAGCNSPAKTIRV
ncbi:MAG: hypothetical protein C4325_06150 [Blastocatellia bacterium]